MRRISSLPTAELERVAPRFWAKVDKSGGADACWPWTASLTRGGYGQFMVLPRQPGGCIRSNRMAWVLTNGLIPDGLHVLHRCDNPPCCNPAHLFLGTNLDNIADRVAKKRSNPKRKLTNRQVVEIFVNLGVVPFKKLANVYEVSPTLIDAIFYERKRIPRCVA